MKKTLLMTSVALLALTGCNDEIEPFGSETVDDGLAYFSATVLEEDASSRASFVVNANKGQFFWTSGDQIGVYRGTGSATLYTLKTGAGTNEATFKGLKVKGATYALYPYADAGSLSGTNLTVNLPASYPYATAMSDYPATALTTEARAALPSLGMPMLAKVSETSSDITFRHLAGIVCFKFIDLPAETYKIKFSTTDKKINGSFTLNLSTTNPQIDNTETPKNADEMSVSVTFPSVEEKSTRVVYFPLPCGEYVTFTITMYKAGGTGDVQTFYKTCTNGFTLDRSYAVFYKDFKEPIMVNGAEAVDFGDGVIWAPMNLGATNPWDYGDYYAWGETTTKSSYGTNNSLTNNKSIYDLLSYTVGGQKSPIVKTDPKDSSKYILTSEYDAATANWHGSWRMPTKAEIERLAGDTYTWTWTTKNGKNGYEVYKTSEGNVNKIFFPATGYCGGSSLFGDGSDGSFWSGTVWPGNSDAYNLYFSSSGHDCGYHYRCFGRSVRPVMTVTE